MWRLDQGWQQLSPMQVGMRVRYTPCISYSVPTGGIGVIGGLRQSPKMLQDSINEIKSHLEDKNAPFGVDLLIPQVGGNARKTNVGLSLYDVSRR